MGEKAEKIKLPKRLQTIGEQIETGKKIIDIGCDHGYLSIYLAQHKCPKGIIATDINLGPLENAKSMVKKYGQEETIEVRKSDGLKEIKEEEGEIFILAGMGGDLIFRILKEWKCKDKREKVFYLQPMSHHKELRENLIKEGYCIQREESLEEQGHRYTILEVVYTGKIEPVSQLYYYLGEHLTKNTKESIQYRQWVLEKLEKRYKGLKRSKEIKKTEEIKGYIQQIKELR